MLCKLHTGKNTVDEAGESTLCLGFVDVEFCEVIIKLQNNKIIKPRKPKRESKSRQIKQ